MTWKRILVYYLGAAVLGLYLQATLEARTPTETLDEKPEFAFVEALASRMDRVLIDRHGVLVEARRVEGRWRFVEPAGAELPSDLIDALLDTLMTIPPIEIFAESSGAADGNRGSGEYGLMPPSTRLRIERDGEIVASIALGARNPTKTAVYAKKAGEESVYLLGLNAQYYIDLLFEHVQRATGERAGAAPSSGTVAPPPLPVPPVSED